MRAPDTQHSPKKEAGAALITTLVLVAAITLLVVGVFSVSRQEVEITGSRLAKTKASLAEKAAFADAASLLRSLTGNDDYLVTLATEGRGAELTRYHFISRPGAGNLIHVPLFAGGEVDNNAMPNLNEHATKNLAEDPIAAPALRFSNPEAVNCIELPRLTHLSGNGSVFTENRFPETGFIELATEPRGDRSDPLQSRYTYWIEDLEGLPDLDAQRTLTDHYPGSSGDPVPDFVRGGYSALDSRTNPSLAGETGMRLRNPANPSLFFQFPKATRGQIRTGQVAPGLSAADRALIPREIPGLEFSAHPFARIRELATDPLSLPERFPNEPAPERNRFTSGLFPYWQRPMIPYGHDYADEGQPRYNINRLVANADMRIAEIMEQNLPDFEQRRGGFPENPADPTLADYTATIAASLIDYADTDSLPSTPANTINTKGQQFRGVDAYCPVNEFFVKFEYRGYTVSAGNYTVILRAEIYAEFWNTFNIPITMEHVGIELEFLDPPQFLSLAATHIIEPSHRTKNEPVGNPVSIPELAPNEIRVVPFGEIEWRVPVGNPGSLPIAFPVVENFKAQPSAGSVNPRANYTLFLNGMPVDSGGRSPAANDDAHGFFFNQIKVLPQNSPVMRVGGSVPRIKAHGTGNQNNSAGHGIRGTTLGDPWMNFFTTSTFDNFSFQSSEYRNHSSPGSRNFSRGLVPSSRIDCFSDQARVRDWPDRGYDNPIGQSPSKDSELPTDPDFILPTDPRHAPWRLSNRGRYFSVTEMGNIHDPVMWVYGDAEATKTLGNQNYRLKEERSLRNPDLVSLPLDAEPNSRWGGGNTLRIGRPEHELFDRPGMRASQLLDLFHAGSNGTNLPAVNAAETSLLYQHFDPAHHLDPPTARNEAEALLDPFAHLYDAEFHAESAFEYRHGRLNLNTVPTLFEMEALLSGPLVSSDIVVDPATADSPITPDYTDEGALGELTKSLASTAVPLIAQGLYQTRPFYSPSHLARVLSELIKRHDALPPHHNDAEAEETFARIFNATSLTSRHFRIHTYGETYEATTGTVLSRDRKVYEVFLEPLRDESGEIETTVLRVIRTFRS